MLKLDPSFLFLVKMNSCSKLTHENAHAMVKVNFLNVLISMNKFPFSQFKCLFNNGLLLQPPNYLGYCI